MTSSNKTNGISTLGALGLIFISLKLIGIINWSWWWVLSPFWAFPIVILLFIALFLFIGWVGGSFK
jgi:hypothetical protein